MELNNTHTQQHSQTQMNDNQIIMTNLMNNLNEISKKHKLQRVFELDSTFPKMIKCFKENYKLKECFIDAITAKSIIDDFS